MIRFLVSQDQKHGWVWIRGTIKMLESDETEIWFYNTILDETVLFAKYENPELAQVAINDYVNWLDDETAPPTFTFLTNGIYKHIWDVREKEWAATINR